MFFGLRLIGRVIGLVFKAVVFVAAIAAVAAAVAYALFDGDQYKERLSKRVFDLTGRTMTVDGKVELDMSWPPRIVLNDVHLKNARWGSRPDMARIRRVEIQINPLRAISGGDSVAQVRLDGADVLLETNPQGLSNWDLGGFAAGGAMGTLGVLNALGLISTASSSAALPTSPAAPPGALVPPSSPTSPPRSPPLAPPPSSPTPSSAAVPPSGGPGRSPSPQLSPPASPPPPVIVSNPNITIRDGRTGREQIVALGAAVELTGGAVVGSHVMAAAASDNTNPCDGSQRQQPSSQ